MRQRGLIAIVIVLATSVGVASAQPTPAPTLAPGRHLRRVTMTLLDRPPTIEELRAYRALPDAERAAWLASLVDRALEGEDFHHLVREWGHEYMRVGYDPTDMDHWDGHRAYDLTRCPEGTTHAGALRENAGDSHTDACDVGPAGTAEPWWAPGTTERVVGDLVVDPETDGRGTLCGTVVRRTGGGYAHDGLTPCGCGPNLVYCTPWTTTNYPVIRPEAGYPSLTSASPHRALFEETARLVEHVVTHDAPFSDLVIGDYTVVNRALHHLYVRQASREPTRHAASNADHWWSEYGGDDEWRAVPFARLDPDLIADRSYAYDPRTATEPPRGVPSAGVLTTASALRYFPRERVRAARFLEIFACREFSPPPAAVHFPRYERDPALEGSCVHCHQTIDPVAVHFKRFMREENVLVTAGLSYTAIAQLSIRPRRRIEAAFVHDTFMTPVDEETIARAPESRLIDFLPEGGLFGQRADGTIGPLGFGRMLVDSGEFDRCAVRQAHRRFRGRDLVPGRDDVLLRELVAHFVSSGRNMRELIREIVLSSDFAQGI